MSRRVYFFGFSWLQPCDGIYGWDLISPKVVAQWKYAIEAYKPFRTVFGFPRVLSSFYNFKINCAESFEVLAEVRVEEGPVFELCGWTRRIQHSGNRPFPNFMEWQLELQRLHERFCCFPVGRQRSRREFWGTMWSLQRQPATKNVVVVIAHVDLKSLRVPQLCVHTSTRLRWPIAFWKFSDTWSMSTIRPVAGRCVS